MDAALLNFMGLVMPFIVHDSDITENFFRKVNSDPGLLKIFKGLCQQYGADNVKKRLGRLIKKTYNLQNTGREKSNSGLIGTYTKH